VIKIPKLEMFYDIANLFEKHPPSRGDKEFMPLSMHQRENVKTFGNILLYTGALFVPLTSCIVKIIGNTF
jgi:hypothetical protein